MQDTQSFAPLYSRSSESGTSTTAGTLQPSVTVSGTTAAAASTVFPGTTANDLCCIQIANKSTTGWAHVNFGVLGGGQTVTAATVAAGYPVAPGGVVVVTVDPEVNAASVILDTGTGNVVFTRGTGI